MNNKLELKKILVIDDDESTNYLTEAYIKRTKIECDVTFMKTVEDSLIFLEKNIDNLPDLIFLDINMHTLSGWDFLKFYQSHNYYSIKKSIILMHSTSVFEKDKDKAKTFPEVTNYIEKPISVEKLLLIKKEYFL